MPKMEDKLPDTPGRLCPMALAGHLTSRYRRLLNNPRRRLAPFVSEGDTVVDLGCGPGFFTLPLAELVGAKGSVIAVDVQEEMLSVLRTRAEEAGLASRITPRLCERDSIGVSGPADFALAYWVLHEAPDQRKFLQETYDLLSTGGRLLLVEPRGHVSGGLFKLVLAVAQELGFTLDRRPKFGLSRGAVLSRNA